MSPNLCSCWEETGESEGTVSSSDEDGEGEDPVNYEEIPVNEMVGSPPVKSEGEGQLSMDCKEAGDDVVH